jgi:hypothetical protein
MAASLGNIGDGDDWRSRMYTTVKGSEVSSLFAAIWREIAGRYTGASAMTGANSDDTEQLRRELVPAGDRTQPRYR